jgi:hypothetical protein
MPFWFTIALAGFGFTLVTGTIRRLSISKIRNAIIALDHEKRKRLLKSYSLAIVCFKILFWMAPLNLMLVPYFVYSCGMKHWTYAIIMLLMMYIIVLEDFSFRKSIINEMKQN